MNNPKEVSTKSTKNFTNYIAHLGHEINPKQILEKKLFRIF
jgi:hypothetical protein